MPASASKRQQAPSASKQQAPTSANTCQHAQTRANTRQHTPTHASTQARASERKRAQRCPKHRAETRKVREQQNAGKRSTSARIRVDYDSTATLTPSNGNSGKARDSIHREHFTDALPSGRQACQNPFRQLKRCQVGRGSSRAQVFALGGDSGNYTSIYFSQTSSSEPGEHLCFLNQSAHAFAAHQ